MLISIEFLMLACLVSVCVGFFICCMIFVQASEKKNDVIRRNRKYLAKVEARLKDKAALVALMREYQAFLVGIVDMPIKDNNALLARVVVQQNKARSLLQKRKEQSLLENNVAFVRSITDTYNGDDCNRLKRHITDRLNQLSLNDATK